MDSLFQNWHTGLLSFIRTDRYIGYVFTGTGTTHTPPFQELTVKHVSTGTDWLRLLYLNWQVSKAKSTAPTFTDRYWGHMSWPWTKQHRVRSSFNWYWLTQRMVLLSWYWPTQSTVLFYWYWPTQSMVHFSLVLTRTENSPHPGTDQHRDHTYLLGLTGTEYSPFVLGTNWHRVQSSLTGNNRDHTDLLGPPSTDEHLLYQDCCTQKPHLIYWDWQALKPIFTMTDKHRGLSASLGLTDSAKITETDTLT